ncbi:MAG: acyl-CoA synthetase [Acidimicrobiales bacterium]
MYPGTFANTTPDKAAIVMSGTGEQMTYAELHEFAERLANLLQAASLQRGDHVALCLENRVEFLAICWGAHYAGLYYTAISSRLTAPEMAYIINDCGARAYITSPHLAAEAAELANLLPDVELRLSVGGAVSGYDALEDLLPQQPTEPIGPRLDGDDMLYSSGTTGVPKGVKTPLRDTALDGPDNTMNLLAALFGADENTRYLSPAPLYHAAPLRFCRSIHRLGGTVVVMERFDPEDLLRQIELHRITFMQVVPTMFVRMLKLDEAVRNQYDVSSLESVVHAAAPCPIPVKRQMIDWWGHVIHEYYAGTEGNGFCYCNSAQWLAHEGTVGMALVGVVHIVNDAGEELPVGKVGNVYFESESGFEYHNDPDKTRSSRLDNGWSTLGDVGRLDEDGFLYLTDRKAFMIICGGVNIYPQEAENVLTVHPKVMDVAVFGVPHPELGEEVKAVVQPVRMADAGDALERELMAYCQQNLAKSKCPRSIDFRDELPRHPTGKLYKRVLRDEYWRDQDR